VSLGYPKCFKKLKALSFKVLVCDWNVRAWTLLEAIRGRRSIYLLCKYNKVLSLRETLEIVHREGSISLSILFLTAQHLLPPPDKDLNETFPSKLYFDMKSKGFVSIEELEATLARPRSLLRTKYHHFHLTILLRTWGNCLAQAWRIGRKR
jgi:hypothetical protein